MLSASEIDIVKEILLVLGPFKVASKELCGQNYITGSKIVPLIHCLLKTIEKVKISSPIVLQLKTAMCKWFGRIEEIQMLTIATILDPIFKIIHFNNVLTTSKAIQTIKIKN